MNQKQHKNYNQQVQVKHGRKQSMTRVFSGFATSLKTKSHALLLRGALIAVAALIVPSSAVVLLFAPQTAQAQTPNTTLNFQARILLASGALVPDGNYNLEFKIYDTVSTGGTAQGAANGGNQLWIETRTGANVVRVVNGYVSVNLGSVTAFGSSIPWSQDLYVVMRVGGIGTPSWDATEMVNATTGRMKISAVPLAFVANNVRTANRTSAASDNITIQTGTTTTSGNSGNITIDTGTAAGTAGTISVGTTTQSGLLLGRAGSQTTITGSSILLNSATLQRTAAGTTNLNLVDGSNTTLSLTNSGAGNLNLTVDGTINTNTQSATAFTFSGANPVISASTAATGLTVQAPTTGTLTLNTVGAGTVNVGTANTTVIGLGSASSTTTVLGVTNINASGTTATTIGNTGSNLTINGILQGNNTTGLTFEGATADGFETTLAVVDPTIGDQIYQLPNAVAAGTYQICTSANNCTGLGAFIQNGTALQATASFNIQTGVTTNDTAVIRQIASQTGALFRAVRSDGTTEVFIIDGATGAVTIRPITNTDPTLRILHSNGTQFVEFDTANDRIGFGTANPTAALEVTKASGSDTILRINSFNTGNILEVEDSGSDVFTIADGGSVSMTGNLTVDTNTLFVDASSNEVGIGTITPASILDIVASGTNSIRLTAGASWPLILQQDASSNFTINNNNTTTLTILGASGNVGIGDTSPASLLTVGNGDLFQVDGTTGFITVVSGAGDEILFSGSNNASILGNSDLYLKADADNNGGTENIFFQDGGSNNIFQSSSNGQNTFGNSFTAATLRVSDGNGQYIGITASDVAADRTISIPVATGSDTFCLLTLANCGGGGSKFTDAGSYTYLTATADRLIVGQSTDVSTTKLAVVSTNSANNVSTFNTRATLDTTTASTRTFNTWLNTDIIPTAAVGANTNYSVLHLWTGVTSAGRLDTTTDIRKIDLYTEYNSSSADTIGSASNIYTSDVVNTNVTVSDFRNIFLNDPGGAGTITRNAALVVANQTKGTNNTNVLLGTTTIPTGNYSIYNSSNYTNLFQGSIVANNSATGTTRTTEATARTNVTTVTTTVAGFANNDVIFINNAGQDYYTRITAGGGTTTLTVSPAVSYDVSATVTLYQNIANIGATPTDYNTQTNRFFQGYFLGGVVTGAGSTTLSDQNLRSTGRLVVTAGSTVQALAVESTGQLRVGGSGTNAGTAPRLTLTPATTDTTNLWNIDNSAGTLRVFRENWAATGTGAGGAVRLSITDAGYATFSGNATINNAFVGDQNACGGYAGFSYAHGSPSCTNYAIIQSSSGNTFVNSAAGQTTGLRIGNTDELTVAGTGITINDALSVGTSASTGTSLTVGSTIGVGSSGVSYGATGWDSSIVLNGAATTSIAFHDSGTAIAQLIYSGTNFTLRGNNGGTLNAVDFSVYNASYESAGVVSSVNGVGGHDSPYLYSTGARSDGLYYCTSSFYNSYDGSGGNLHIDNDTSQTGGSGCKGIYIGWYGNTAADNFTAIGNGNSGFGNLRIARPTGNTNNTLCLGTAASGNEVGSCTSSARFKSNIQNGSYGLGALRQLRPVSFNWNSDGDADIGFIAEEVAAVLPQIVQYDASGQVYSFSYDSLASVLTKSLQQLDVQVQANDVRLSVLESGTFSGNITVAGYADITGKLTVHNDLEVQQNLKVLGNTEVAQLTVNGKIITAGATPTIVLGAQATGQGAVSTVTGNDTAGTVTYEAGIQNLPTNPLVAGEQVHVDFVSAYSTQPRVNITPTTEAAALARYYVERTTTGFTIVFVDTPQSGMTYSYDYQILQ